LLSVSRVCGRDDVQGIVAADFAAGTLLVKSAWVLHDPTTAAQDAAELFRAQAERRGIRVLELEALRGPTDVDPLIAAIRARAPGFVFGGGGPDGAAGCGRRARGRGVRAPLLGPEGLASREFARRAKAAAIGVYYTSVAGPPAILPGARPFVEDFHRRFGRA